MTAELAGRHRTCLENRRRKTQTRRWLSGCLWYLHAPLQLNPRCLTERETNFVTGPFSLLFNPCERASTGQLT